ncbi:MAG: hypothetical protein SGILL_008246, partial [Bacillariaceae sp.]
MMDQSSSNLSGTASSSSTECHTNKTTRTVLRIKRRRTEHPLPGLRLEGVSNVPQHVIPEESSYQQSQQSISKKRSSAVLWKRLDPLSADVEATSNSRYRIVNAVFDNDKETVEDEEGHHKRRKLTVLNTVTTDEHGNFDGNNPAAPSPLHSLLTGKNTSTPTSSSSPTKKKKKKQPLKILDPLTRIIDDSLNQVLQSTHSCHNHFLLLTTDSRFTLQPAELQHKWMAWRSASGNNNLLHCCALWNDSTTASELLQHSGSIVQSSNSNNISGNSNNESLQSTLMEAVDEDGRTPYEVAKVVGHTSVQQVLEAYGGDTSNYVYDIFYYLDDRDEATSDREFWDAEDNNEGDNPSDVMMITAKLTSGVGYWTPEGELVLEANEKHAQSLSHETDGDIDSNCE